MALLDRKHFQDADRLSALPKELLVRIMGCTPCNERLLGWAPASSKLKAAAIAVTTSVKLVARNATACASFVSWLQSCMHEVTSIDLTPYHDCMKTAWGLPCALATLPCASLRQLQLTDCEVQLGDLLQYCAPALTSLSLRNCSVLQDGLDGLWVLENLRAISATWDPCSKHAEGKVISQMPGSLLSQLVQLTCIELSSTLQFDGLQHISCLTGLQHLQAKLAAPREEAPEPLGLAGISSLQRLTCLHLACVEAPQRMGLRLLRLTALRKLSVELCTDFDPTELAGAHELQELAIINSSLSGNTDAHLAPSMLAVLSAYLTAVTHLNLRSTLTLPTTDTADYAALGALSQLEELNLAGCNLPEAVWPHLAAAGMAMHSVRSLTLDSSTPGPQVSADGLAALVQCFPSLDRLSIAHAIQPGVSLQPLEHLHRLKHLVISNVTKTAVVTVLAILPRLLSLGIEAPSGMNDFGLLRLTALTELTSLRITAQLSHAVHTGKCRCLRCSGKPQAQLCITDTSSEKKNAKVSNVPQQLLARCIRSNTCQPKLVPQLQAYPRLHQDLEQARRDLKAVRQELHLCEAKLAAANRQAARAEASAREAHRRERQSWQKVAHAEDRLGDMTGRERRVAEREQRIASQDARLRAREQEVAAAEARLGARLSD